MKYTPIVLLVLCLYLLELRSQDDGEQFIGWGLGRACTTTTTVNSVLTNHSTFPFLFSLVETPAWERYCWKVKSGSVGY